MPKLKRTFLLSIIPLFWLGMVSSLVVMTTQTSATDIYYLSTHSETYTPEIGSKWYSLTRDEKLVGYIQYSLQETGDEAEYHLMLLEETGLYTPIGNEDTTLLLSINSELDLNLLPTDITAKLMIGAIPLEVTGSRTDNIMKMKINGPGSETEREMTISDRLSTTFSLYLSMASLEWDQNEQRTFATFEPLTQSQTTIKVTYLEQEYIEIQDALTPALKFEMQASGITSTVWLDQHGNLLQEQAEGLTSTLVTFLDVREIYRELHPLLSQ